MDDEVERIFREGGLTGVTHRVDEQLLLRELRESYGLDGGLTRLDTEKDATFRLRGAASTAGAAGAAEETGTAETREYLVKVSQPEEPLDIVRCQVDVVAWLEERGPGIPVQTVLPARDGARWRRLVDDEGRFCGILRVHEFIPGRLLVEEDPSPEQLRAVGAMLGRVDTALGDFSHPGDERVFVWDLTRFLSLEPLIELEPDEQRRSLAQAVFDAYRSRVTPALPAARKQVIHGDFSPYNAVVDPAADDYVTGVIDFGDTLRGPVVFDPAVLLGNHLQQAPGHPWELARELLDGYRGAYPLSDDEVDLVAVASVARITLRALVTNRRLAQGTERAEYVLQHTRDDWGRIENAIAFGFDEAHRYLLRAGAAQHHETSTRH